jgi:hypothetical protein
MVERARLARKVTKVIAVVAKRDAALTELTGNPIVAQQALCRLDLSTAMRHYIKTRRSALAEGIQMLDERLAFSK